jgi:hypothetical protein
MNRLSGEGARPRPCGTTIVTEPAPVAPKTGTGDASGLCVVRGTGRIPPAWHGPAGRISSAPDSGGKRTRRRLRSLMAPGG